MGVFNTHEHVALSPGEHAQHSRHQCSRQLLLAAGHAAQKRTARRSAPFPPEITGCGTAAAIYGGGKRCGGNGQRWWRFVHMPEGC